MSRKTIHRGLAAAALVATALYSGTPASAADWSVTKNEFSTSGSHDMTLDVGWTVKAKPNLAASTVLFLPFQGVRISLDEWSLQRASLSGPTQNGNSHSETCTAVSALLGGLQQLMEGVQVADPDDPGAVGRAIRAVSNLIGDTVHRLGAGTGEPSLQQAFDEALGALTFGCEALLQENKVISNFAPGYYRVDAEGSASLVEMLAVGVNANGSISLGVGGVGGGGRLSLGADAHPVKTLRADAQVKLKCPDGTAWNEERSICLGQQPDGPGSPGDCPEGAVPGSEEYCACWDHVFEEVCFDCEFSDGSTFPTEPGDPPIDDSSTNVCRSNYPWLYEDGQVCAIIELFCLGGPFPRFKVVPPGTTGEPLMGCSDGLSWGPCPGQPEGLPLLIPEMSPSEGFPPCWRVGGVIVNPVPGLCDGSASPDLPDLVVESVHLSAGLPQAGEDFALVTRLRNEGPVVAASSKLRLLLETPSGPVGVDFQGGSLNPGQERQLEIAASQIPYDTLPGPHSVQVTADPEGTVTELLETNNSAQTAFTVGSSGGPGNDLSVGELELHPDHPTADGPVEVRFTVLNSGSTSLAATEYEVRVDHGPDAQVFTFPVAALAAGEGSQETFTLATVEAGAYSVAVLVDSGSAVAETNEDNNSVTRSFTVDSGSTECLPCTSGAPTNSVGAEFCTDPADPNLPPWQGDLFLCLGVRANGTSCEPSGNHPNGWSYVGPRCPDPATLFEGSYHQDRCGNPGVCPGTRPLPF